MRYSVIIQNKENKYTGILRYGEKKNAWQLPNLELGPEVEVPLNGETRRLGELVEEFMRYDPIELKNSFDERGQLEIGQYLFSQLFEKINSTDAKHFLLEKDVDLRIVTSDEHISRLPWPLLANKGIFLSTVGWSASISSRVDIEDCELPPSPRMLVLAPQPAKLERTQAESHLEELGNKLSESDHRLAWGRNLRLARTLDEFAKLLKHDNFKPEIVYYYGHGTDDSQKAQLRFAVGKKRDLRDIPMANFALFFRKMKVPLRLAYINCCYGDAAGFLGAGRQLGDFIPAVIANRTVVEIPVAQAQAIALWESILLKGTPPHKAVSELYVNMGDIDLSVSDVRWIAPVVHCHYDKWKANPPSPPSRMVHDPFWHLKIDRVAQFGTVATQTRQMLRECKPRSLAFVWYGKKGQGIETFHRRLNVELREDNPSAFVFEIRPEWPAEFHNPHRSIVPKFGWI